MDKIKLALTFAGIISIIAIGLYWLSVDAEKSALKREEALSKGYKFSKGIITKKHSYKGHTIRVKYRIDNKNYEYSGGWDHNPRNIEEGDSISFKYATNDPQFIMTELEDGY